MTDWIFFYNSPSHGEDIVYVLELTLKMNYSEKQRRLRKFYRC